MSGRRPPIAAVLLPHGCCPRGCPFCPPAGRILAPLPGTEVVTEAVERTRARRGDVPVEIAFYGGDLWALPRGPRTALLDAAEAEVRRGRAVGIRLALTPESVLRAPLAEFRARGVRTVEVGVWTMARAALERMGARRPPRSGTEAMGRLTRARLRPIAALMPGLPGSSHRTALASVDAVLRARPGGVRLLPALALGGTKLGDAFAEGTWVPMAQREAVTTCKEMLRRVRAAGVPILRVGLQPDQDLWEAPQVLGGPYVRDLRMVVESELLRAEATRTLTSVWSFGTRAVTFVVCPREESWLRGPENATIRQLQERFRLDEVRILPVAEQPAGRVRVLRGLVEAAAVPRLPRARKAS